MNKNIKNALLLSAAMSVSGAWAAGYDESQFDTSGPTLTRKDSGKFDHFMRDDTWASQSDADTARGQYKKSFAARLQANDDQIALLQAEVKNPDSVPGLVTIPGGVQNKHKSTVNDASGNPLTWGEVKQKNEELKANTKKRNDELEKRIDLIKKAKEKKEKLISDSDLVTHKTRAEERKEAFDTGFTADLGRYRALAETLPESMSDADVLKLFQGVAKIQLSDMLTQTEHKTAVKSLQDDLKSTVDDYNVLAKQIEALTPGLDIGDTDAVAVALENLLKKVGESPAKISDNTSSKGDITSLAPAPSTPKVLSKQGSKAELFGFEGSDKLFDSRAKAEEKARESKTQQQATTKGEFDFG